MSDSNPTESLDAEGIPELEELPPGRDIETNEEALMAPRDHPIAAGADPAYAVTAAEEISRESVADRASRENPDFGEASPAVDDGIGASLMEPDSDIGLADETAEALGTLGADDNAPSAEEAAVHVVSEDVADDLDPAIERAEYLGEA